MSGGSGRRFFAGRFSTVDILATGGFATTDFREAREGRLVVDSGPVACLGGDF
jgi:hypothetical protein